jgi:hypothetical protein
VDLAFEDGNKALLVGKGAIIAHKIKGHRYALLVFVAFILAYIFYLVKSIAFFCTKRIDKRRILCYNKQVLR